MPDTLTESQLKEQQNNLTNIVLGHKRLVEVGEVFLWRNCINSLCFSYKNARGLVFADSVYLAPNKFRLKARLDPSFSNQAQYALRTDPNPEAIAEGIIEAWNKFIS